MAPILDFEGHIREVHPRLRWLFGCMIVAFGILVGRLAYLQLVKGEHYFQYAARNAFKSREIAAPRGIIFDSRGNRIADVRPSFDVVIRPNLIRRHPGRPGTAASETLELDIHALARVLSRILHIPAETVVDRFNGAKGRARYKPVVIKADVSRDEMAAIEAHRIDLPGVEIQVGQKRTYPFGGLFSHLVGYLGEISGAELKRLRELYAATKGEDYYEIGDFVGRYGIEKQYEPYLKGEDGVYYVLEDATGRVVTSLSPDGEGGESYVRSMLAHLSQRGRPAVPGNDLILTVDLELQRHIQTLMEGHVGSVVAMEPDTGRILAMYNNPTFDPEMFARGISREVWDRLRNDPGHPLEDKALRGQYPPGSTFKMIPALAGLAEGVVTPSTTVYCPGYIKIGGRRFRCHKRGGHGFVNLHKALVESCDVYFYALGVKLGISRIARYAHDFGLGVPTGLGLNHGKAGLVASDVWKARVIRQPWVIGDTVSASIGQGYNLVTPLQLARYTSVIANGGRLMRPFVVERIQTVDGRIIKQREPREVSRLQVKPETLRIIQEAMLGVLEEPTGTARRSKLKGIHIAGKTGTAQVVRREQAERTRTRKKAFQDHALFTAYAPYEHPEIVVSVIIEHGGHGGAVAAPIAREVMRKFFQDRGEWPRPRDARRGPRDTPREAATVAAAEPESRRD